MNKRKKIAPLENILISIQRFGWLSSHHQQWEENEKEKKSEHSLLTWSAIEREREKEELFINRIEKRKVLHCWSFCSLMLKDLSFFLKWKRKIFFFKWLKKQSNLIDSFLFLPFKMKSIQTRKKRKTTTTTFSSALLAHFKWNNQTKLPFFQ